MTNEDLITELSQRLQWTQTKTSDVLTAVVSIMNEKLAEEEQISIHNFGVFETRKKSEHISVNSLTQQRYLVPPKIIPVFKPALSMRKQLKKDNP